MNSIEKNTYKYSTGVVLLGKENVYEYIKNILKISNLEIVSVGSGNGIIEKNIEEKFNIKMICIDPTPLLWSLSTDENRLPDYDTTSDLLKERNKLKNNCNLLINWSYPDHSYDIESIIMLKPRNIIIITDLSEKHAAGGFELHKFMKRCGVPSKIKNNNEFDISRWHLEKYNFVYRTFTQYSSHCGMLEISIIWLSLDIINNNANINVEVNNSEDYKIALIEYNLQKNTKIDANN
jgi:hypothetical protein